jgi:CheY-like chemotaxis protein
MSLSAPVALVIQPSPLQAHLWAQALGSQNIQVIQEFPRPELLSYLERHQPDVLIVDMTTGLFNPYGFCRECRGQFPALPVILTYQPEQPLEAAARRWAIYQGAADVMPGLVKTVAILDSIYQVMSLMGLGSRFNEQALLQTVGIAAPPPVLDRETPLPDADSGGDAGVANALPVEALPEQSPNGRPLSAARTQRMFRGRPVI